RWQHYHQPTDTPDRLNYDKMERIKNYLLALTRSLSETSLAVSPGRPGREEDTTLFELALIGEALGKTGLQLLASAVGLTHLQTSAHLDILANRLQSYFEL